MKSTQRAARYFLLACVLAYSCPPVFAQFVWSGATTTNWNLATNWVGNVLPPSANTTFITFAPATGTATSVVDVAWTINRLDVDLPPRTISGSPLTFDGAGAAFNTIDLGHSISNDLVLAQTLTITNNQALTLPGGITGPGSLVAAGSALLDLSGPGFHTGTTTVNPGATLRISGTPTIITMVNNGELQLAVPGGTTITNPVTGTGNVTVNFSALGTFQHAGTTTVSPASLLAGGVFNNALLSIDGTLDTGNSTVGSLAGSGQLNNNGGTFTVGSDNTSTLFGGNIASNGAFTKLGTGTLTLGGTVSSGTITVNGGTLRLGTGGTQPATVITAVTNAALEFNVAFPSATAVTNPVIGSGTIAVTGFAVATLNHLGTTFVAPGARLDGAINNAARFTLDGQFNTGGTTIGSLAGAATGTMNINSGTLAVGADNTSSTFLGPVTGPGDLVKTGTGKLTLAGTQLNNGLINILGGTLAIGNGVSGPLTAITIVNNGALELQVPTGVGITNPVTGTGTVSALGGLAFGTFNHTNTTSVSAGAQLDGTINNNFRLTLDGIMNTGGSSVGSLAGAASGRLNINAPGTFTVGTDNTDSTFAGVVASNGFLDKVGTGRLTLSGTNTHFGGVHVLGGTLAVSGTYPSFFHVNAPGATLEVTGTISVPLSVFQGQLTGTGTITAPVIVNPGGTLAPGLGGPGIINTNGLFMVGTLAAQILGPVVGTQYDQVNVTGTVSFNNATLNLIGGYVPVPGDTFTLINNDGVDPVTGTTGTFAGLPEGATLTFNGVTLRISYVGGDGNDVVLSHAAYTVTSSGGGPNGTITPPSQSVAHGSTTTFTVTPSVGYTASVGGTCPVGSLVGTTYTTGAITGACNVAATFTLNTYTVTSSGGGANGTITPPSQLVNHGSTTTFTVTPSVGYTASVGGTCPVGSLVGTTYTTGAITGACDVAATFTLNTYAVNASAGANGTIAPPTRFVNHGSTAGFTVTPNPGYIASVGGTCPPGSLAGSTYTTGIITAACNVNVTFALTSYTVTASAAANGTISPPSQTVAHGGTTTFTVTPNVGYTAMVGGTCLPGSLAGTTYATGVITADCTVTATFTLNSYTVNASAGANGTITPPSQTVAHGATTTFTVTPSAGYTAAVGGTCPAGSFVGTTYTTGVITAACTVSATFALGSYTVTATAGANGTITPPSQTVAHGATTTFTVTPNAGYTSAVGGTCVAGTLVGTTYTTGAITAACTVTASFTLNSYTVTASAGANGTITPPTQTVAHGATTTFTVTPNAGYTATVGGTCGGTLAGTTYTTNAITAACTVVASFTAGAVTSFTGPTATGTGNATASFTGGGPTCTFAVAQLIPVSGHAASPPAGTAPASIVFPHGLFDFRLALCTPGSTITMTITYPSALPAGTSYWKYGPEPGNATPHWYVMPSTLGTASVVFSITDGQQGDDDLTANGTIVDQGGPGAPVAFAQNVQTPTMSEWTMLLMALLMLLGAWKLGPRPEPRLRRRGRRA